MKTVKVCTCVFLCSKVPVMLPAQNAATGTVSRTVPDQESTVITNDTITVKGPAVTGKTTTNAECRFTDTGLPAGTYKYGGSISHPFAGRAF